MSFFCKNVSWLLFGWVSILLVACGSKNQLSTAKNADLLSTIGCSPTSPTNTCLLPFTKLNGCTPSDYSVGMQIGSTAGIPQLLFDTGSADLALAGSDCSTCSVSPQYIPTSKASSNMVSVSADYADGTGWTGIIYQDTVALATAVTNIMMHFVAMTTPYPPGGDIDNSFFRATTCSGSDTSNTFQGILGMASKKAAVPGDDAFSQILLNNNNTGLFAVQLCDLNGRLWFNTFDPYYTRTAPQYLLMAPQSSLYTVQMQSLSLDTLDLALPTATTIVDTGTSLAYIPDGVFDNLNTALNNNGNFINIFGNDFMTGDNGFIPLPTGLQRVDVDAALPSMQLTFLGQNANNSVVVQLPATQSYLLPILGPDGTTVYYGPGVAKLGSNTPTILLGSSFMHGHIWIFDPSNNRLGLAPQQDCVHTF